MSAMAAGNMTGFIECKLSSVNAEATYLGSCGGETGDVYNITWTGPEANQEWEFQEVKDGVYEIIKVEGGKAITALEGNTVEQRTLNDNDEYQQWSFEVTAAGAYQIRNIGTSQYFTTSRTAESDDRFGTITTKGQENSDSQLWTLEGAALT